MRPRRHAITRTIMLVTFVILMLSTFSSGSTYDDKPINEMESPNTFEEDFTDGESELESSPDNPNGDYVPSSRNWYWTGCDSVYSQSYGTTTSIGNLAGDDGAMTVLAEEWIPDNWRFEVIYRTPVSLQHQYIHRQLRFEFTQDWTLAPEDLKISVALCSAAGAPIQWTTIWTGDSTVGPLAIDIDSSLVDYDIPESRRVAVKVEGTIESGDWGTQNTWRFDFLGIAFKDHKPYLTAHSCDADESLTLYPRHGSPTSEYYAEFSQTIYCRDGHEEIEYVSFVYYDFQDGGSGSGLEDWWAVYWDEGDWGISYYGDVDNTWARLIESECTSSTTTYSRTVSFAVRIDFGHRTDEGLVFANVEYTSYAWAEFTSNLIKDYYDYRVESRLDMQTSPIISEFRVPQGSTCTFSGDVEYYGSPSHLAPPSDAVDIQVRRTGPDSTDWIYDAQPASDGTFSVNPSTASTSGTNDFELRVVADAYTTNLLSSTISDSVVGDRIVVSSGSIGSDNYNAVYDGGVRNTGQADTLFLELEWESSPGTTITSGISVSWASSGNTVSMSYASGHWEGDTYTRSSVGELTYNDLMVSVSGTEYEVTSEPSYSVLWDEIEILTTVIESGDDYVNIDNSITIRVTAQLRHLGHALDSGVDTLYMNGVKMSDGGTYFTYTISSAYPAQLTFSVDDSNALEATYGITKITSGKPSVSCIWDTHMVELSIDDAHVDINDYVRIWAYVTRAYDGSVFTDSMGSLSLRHSTSGDLSMTYDDGSQMWYYDVTQTDVGQWVYYIYSISDSTEGITTVGKGLNFDGVNDRVDCGDDSSLDLTATLTLSAWFYGDGSTWGTGMYILAKKDTNNAQYALYIHSDGTLQFVYYNGALREIALQSGVSRNSWHHIIVTVSGTTLNAWFDGTHIQDDYTLPVALNSYPAVPLTIGAERSGAGTSYHFEGFVSEVRVYSTTLTDVQCELLYQGQYPSDTYLELLLERTSIDSATWGWNDASTNSNDGSIYGAVIRLGVIPMSSDEVVRPIWDQVINMGYSSDNLCIDVSALSSNHVNLEYAYGGDPVLDGIITVNGLSTSPSGYDGEWDFSDTKSSAQLFTYDFVSYSGGRYNLTSIDQNGQSLGQEWNEVLILTTEVIKSHLDLFTQAEIRVTARLSYFSVEPHMLGSGDTLILNGVSMQWHTDGYFFYRPSKGTVDTWNYYVNDTANEETFGISAVNRNSTNVDITWTGLIISISDPVPQWLDLGVNASGIHVSVTYAHNGESYDGTITLNNTIFLYNDAGRHGYSLLPSSGDDSLGISYVVSADETSAIWDGYIITITDPSPQTILVGQNASGIYISAVSAYDGLIFDGIITLNNTEFEYHSEGIRGYTVTFLSGGSRGVSTIAQNDETYAIWIKVSTALNMACTDTDIFVSTVYDPQSFDVTIWLTNSTEQMISGWVNITLNGQNTSIYCDGFTESIFLYSPLVAGEFIIQASYSGDAYIAPATNNIILNAIFRSISYDSEIPTIMIATVDSSFSFLNVFDDEFSGVFQDITYILDYPINASFEIWWTLSSDYGTPRNYVNNWNVYQGSGTANWVLPWDLDGNGHLTENDFVCYLIITIDGHGVYEDTEINMPMSVLQNLQLDFQIPNLTYSDPSELTFQVAAYYDPTYANELGIEITLYCSTDNSSWAVLDTLTTNSTGYANLSWLCDNVNTLFFKVETAPTEFYTSTVGYTYSTVEKETTTLTIDYVEQFTYSDQGIVIAHLATNDGEPVVDYPVYLEILDGNWVSCGSGITNETGHVSILWVPYLPAGSYSIQVRALLTDSQFYMTPVDAGAQLSVEKESLGITVDITTASQGLVLARVTDDESNSVEGVSVKLYMNDELIRDVTTDSNGYAYFNITVEGGETLRLEIIENAYYFGLVEEVVVVLPPDILMVTILMGLSFMSLIGVAILRKMLVARTPAPTPEPAPPELEEAITTEIESKPERIREKSVTRLKGIEGTDSLVESDSVPEKDFEEYSTE